MKYRSFLILLLFTVVTMMFIYSDYMQSSNTNISEEETVILSVEKDDDKLTKSAFSSEEIAVIPSGEPVGIYVKTDGVMVVDTKNIRTCDGGVTSPAYKKLKQGDYITEIDGNKIKDKKSLIDTVRKSEGRELNFTIFRNGNKIHEKIRPILNVNGEYMLGVWVKDDISGIGTLTFIHGSKFYALGHSINDNDTGIMFLISEGAIYNTNLMSIKRPQFDKPGKLEGYIDYRGENIIGIVDGNSQIGICGNITKEYEKEIQGKEAFKIAAKNEVKLGDITLVSYISGKKEYYDARITKIDFDAENKRCMEILITDDKLINLTGGIVQGMSGTPILQNDKLVGAITHVFVNDSTKGYAIFIEDMIEE